MVAITPLLYVGWKVLKRSTLYKLEEVDLVKDLDEIEEYEAAYVPQPPKYVIPCIFTYSSCQHLSHISSSNAGERVLDLLFG